VDSGSGPGEFRDGSGWVASRLQVDSGSAPGGLRVGSG
jgi:hypothetical protein